MKNKFLLSLCVSSLISILLLYARIEWSGSIRYVFLAWNLFLAWIPFVFVLLLKAAVEDGKSIWVRLPLFACWLLFFPNSPYILTDLFHLDARPGVPLWFDLVLLLSFAWNGLLLGFASLFYIRNYLKQRFSDLWVSIFIISLMVLCSFGIYLGRYPRWNSWDLFSNPVALFTDILDMITHPRQNPRMVGVTFFFSLFLIAGFWSLQALVHSVKAEENER
jgi:uncharacterized membrane protein